jgi:hypothetical protein
MDAQIPTLPNYGAPMPRQKAVAPSTVPILTNHKDQKPLVSLTKKLFNKKMTKFTMPKLKNKKVPDPFKKRKKARVV